MALLVRHAVAFLMRAVEPDTFAALHLGGVALLGDTLDVVPAAGEEAGIDSLAHLREGDGCGYGKLESEGQSDLETHRFHQEYLQMIESDEELRHSSCCCKSSTEASQ